MILYWVAGLSLVLAPAAALANGDKIDVSVNKVWPVQNPMETYGYYDALPVCEPEMKEKHRMTFGQIMRGDRLVNSLYDIEYLTALPTTAICKREMSANELARIREAISKHYQFEIYVADLPVSHPVGHLPLNDDGKLRYEFFTGWDFDVGANEAEVVAANLTMRDSVDITEWREGFTIEFTYSVTWHSSDIPKSARLQRQLEGVLPVYRGSLNIHWMSIMNSFFLVLFILFLLLLIILRVVRSDLSKYLRISDEELAAGGVVEEESGWKLLHADVFRPPPHRMWFAACVGSGAHIFLVTATLVSVGLVHPYVGRGSALSGGVILYLITSFVSGYISANLYRRLGGEKWAWNILLAAVMFMGPVYIIWSILNLIAILYSSTAALPFVTAALVFVCWFFVTLPLTIVGGILGRKRAAAAMEGKAPFPCKTNKLPRQIPAVPWYQSPWTHMVFSGFLPFSAISIELHYVFSSVWGSNLYTLYGVLTGAVVMLLMVAAAEAVLLTYLHLNSEDHRWWWRSFASGGSVALFYYIYSAYYFTSSTRMYGILQVTFFFGYSLLVAWGIFLMVGFVTFGSTYLFVTYIYSRSKSD